MEVHRLPYGGDWDTGNDLALLRVYSPSTNIRFSGWARIWLGSTTLTNCGACATPWNSLQWLFGYGLTRQADDYLEALHWGWVRVSGNWWNQFSSAPWDADNNDVCAGDSGGPTGDWHGTNQDIFAIAGVNSAGWCGENGRFGSWYARPKYHWVWIRDTVGCSVVWLGDGYALEC